MAGATSPASSIFFPPRIVAEMRPSQRGFGPRLDRGPSATALGGCHRPPWAMSALREGVSAASQSAYSAACTRPRHLGSLGCTGSTGTGTGSVLYRVPVLYRRRGEALWERVEAGSGSPGAASSESAAARGERSTPGLRLFLRLLSRSRFSCGCVVGF